MSISSQIKPDDQVIRDDGLRNNMIGFALIAITLLSWLIFDLETNNAIPMNIVSAVLLALALLKARLILSNFMELRLAPRLLRALFDGWLVVVGCGLLLFVL